MKTITIYFQGGVIQGIEGIPEGIEVMVYDYDLENNPENDIFKRGEDDEGNPCYAFLYTKESTEQ